MWKRIILKYRIGKIVAVMTRMKKETRQECFSKIINALRASKTFPEKYDFVKRCYIAVKEAGAFAVVGRGNRFCR